MKYEYLMPAGQYQTGWQPVDAVQTDELLPLGEGRWRLSASIVSGTRLQISKSHRGQTPIVVAGWINATTSDVPFVYEFQIRKDAEELIQINSEASPFSVECWPSISTSQCGQNGAEFGGLT